MSDSPEVSVPQGFIWYELMTSDVEAARSFYAAVVGWTARDVDGSGMPYVVMSAGERMVAGMMPVPEEARAAGVPPCWVGYIQAGDADAATARAVEAGARVLRAPADIPGVGRFSVLADPGGAVVQLLAPSGAGLPPAEAGTPGHVGWHELYVPDWRQALAFYGGQFGWTPADALDMGPMGTYQMFAVAGRPFGGMMNKPAEFPAPGWLFYFTVTNLDAAVARATGAGGRVVFAPHQVPGGSWIAQCRDPQGALFALVAPAP